jgi:phosphoribosylamine-glycine ligase
MASGHSIEAAFKQVEHRLKGIQIPNCQIRTDIEKTTTEKYNQLQEWGWLST